MTEEKKIETFFSYGLSLAKASADGMKGAAILFALADCNGKLPKTDPRKTDLKQAREEMQNAIKAMNEKTAEAIKAVFPKLAAKLVKVHGMPGKTAEGENKFWDVLGMEPEAALAFAVSHIKADMAAEKVPYTWQGLRAYAGFKPGGGKTKTVKERATAAVKWFIDRYAADELSRDDISKVILALNDALAGGNVQDMAKAA